MSDHDEEKCGRPEWRDGECGPKPLPEDAPEGWELIDKDHYLNAPPEAVCDRCGRHTWARYNLNEICGMPQPDGHICGGRFVVYSFYMPEDEPELVIPLPPGRNRIVFQSFTGEALAKHDAEVAAKALEDAAAKIFNGAPGRLQSLYNEGANPWLLQLAAQIRLEAGLDA